MDTWDLELTNHLASEREILLFAGQCRRYGPAGTCSHCCELPKIDLVGFSLGRFAQQVLLDDQNLVRRAILAGTGPRGGEGFSARDVETRATLTTGTTPEGRVSLFFTETDNSKAVGRRLVERLQLRKQDREPFSAT